MGAKTPLFVPLVVTLATSTALAWDTSSEKLPTATSPFEDLVECLLDSDAADMVLVMPPFTSESKP